MSPLLVGEWVRRWRRFPRLMIELSKFWTIEKHKLMMLATATRLLQRACVRGTAACWTLSLLALVWPLLRALHWFALSCDSVRDIVQRMLRQCSTVVMRSFNRSSTGVTLPLLPLFAPVFRHAGLRTLAVSVSMVAPFRKRDGVLFPVQQSQV